MAEETKSFAKAMIRPPRQGTAVHETCERHTKGDIPIMSGKPTAQAHEVANLPNEIFLLVWSSFLGISRLGAADAIQDRRNRVARRAMAAPTSQSARSTESSAYSTRKRRTRSMSNISTSLALTKRCSRTIIHRRNYTAVIICCALLKHTATLVALSTN